MMGQSGGSPGAALATMLGEAMLDRMLDGMISATSFATLLEQKSVNKRSLADFVGYAFFMTPTTFRVDLVNPEKPDKGVGATLILTLTGGAWRVTNIVLGPEVVRAMRDAQQKKSR
jgi:hypothetical protein